MNRKEFLKNEPFYFFEPLSKHNDKEHENEYKISKIISRIEETVNTKKTVSNNKKEENVTC